MSNQYFYCKSREIANYLSKHGCKIIRLEEDQKTKGSLVYIFEKDNIIDDYLKKWKISKQRCLF